MKLGLGTAQFGLDYGISNPKGKTPLAEACRILDYAAEQDITVLDTAPAYGSSEEVLGEIAGPQFTLVTKVRPVQREKISTADADRVEEEFQESLRRLRRKSVYGLMAHRADDLLVPGGETIWERMRALKHAGLVEKIGASVYSGAQLDLLRERFPLEIVQVPANVFDQRLIEGGHLRALKAAGVEVHARSPFLQGLLVMEPEQLPARMDAARGPLARLNEYAKQKGASRLQIALGFVMSIPGVDRVICGVNTRAQLVELVAAVDARVSLEELKEFRLNDPAILDPSRWVR